MLMGALQRMSRPAVVPAVRPLMENSDRRPQINGAVGWQEDLHRVFALRGASVRCETE